MSGGDTTSGAESIQGFADKDRLEGKTVSSTRGSNELLVLAPAFFKVGFTLFQLQ